MPHSEAHRSHRSGWLRAAVLGANDGVISTASLLLGVASAHASRGAVLIAGVAGLAAGAMAMGAGEYVSVSSQADIERADLAMERQGIDEDEAAERDELAEIYVKRGLDPELAGKVADQLMAHDALGAHARDELGINENQRARPLQAAFASLASFTVGAVMPVLIAVVAPQQDLRPLLAGASLVLLALLGALAARAGGANIAVGAARVCFWGALAMGVTAAIGMLFQAPI
jgi:vacuolar iron transporter family protein